MGKEQNSFNSDAIKFSDNDRINITGKGDKQKMTVRLDENMYKESLKLNGISLEEAKKVQTHDAAYIGVIDGDKLIPGTAEKFKANKDLKQINVQAPYGVISKQSNVLVANVKERTYPGVGEGADSTTTSPRSTTVNIHTGVTKTEHKANQKKLFDAINS